MVLEVRGCDGIMAEVTVDGQCCCSCVHNIRKSDEKMAGIYCECELDGHYISYAACFVDVCGGWKYDARCAMQGGEG